MILMAAIEGYVSDVCVLWPESLVLWFLEVGVTQPLWAWIKQIDLSLIEYEISVLLCCFCARVDDT